MDGSDAYMIFTEVSVFLAGIATWIGIVFCLVALDRKIFKAAKPSLLALSVLNLALSLVLAFAQFWFLEFFADLFTGWGMGYAGGVGWIACLLGAAGAAPLSTFLFLRKPRRPN